jgi:hypothetical protein
MDIDSGQYTDAVMLDELDDLWMTLLSTYS